MMKLATTTADLEHYFPRAEQNEEKLRLLHQCGFRHIDLCMYTYEEDSPFYGDEWERWADRLGELAAALGMDFVQAHSCDSTYDPGEKRSRKNQMLFRQFAICQRLGIPATVVHAVCTPGGSRREYLERNGALYRELLAEAEKYGVQVLTENTCEKNAPDCPFLEASDYFELKDAVGDHPLFGCCWDVGHAHIQGVDQYRELTALGKDLRAVHIHDNTGTDTHIMPYLGTISMDEIMTALTDMGYSGAFTFEADSSLRPAHYWQGSRKKFEKMNLAAEPPLELALKMEEALYCCGKYLLTQYDCFEG